MKTQIIKGFAMVMVVVAVAFATAVISVHGQSNSRVVSNVPFDFIVGDKALPAGEYQVTPATPSGGVVMIRSSDGHRGAVRLTNSIGPEKNSYEAKLVFHRYGDKYFLSEVWSGADNTGRVLLRSKQENSLKREYSNLAKNTYETIEVVAMVR